MGVVDFRPRSDSKSHGLDVKLAKALDSLSHRLGVPVADLKRRLRQVRRELAKPARVAPPEVVTNTPNAPADPNITPSTVVSASPESPAVPESLPVRVVDLDPLEREMIEIALAHPDAVTAMAPRVHAWLIKDPTLSAILQVCYDLRREDIVPTFDRVVLRLDDNPAARALAIELVMPGDTGPLTSDPAPWAVRLAGALKTLEIRERKARLKDVFAAVLNHDGKSESSDNRSLYAEAIRLKSPGFRPTRPVPPTGNAP